MFIMFSALSSHMNDASESHNDYRIITSGFFIKWYIRYSLWEIKSHVSVNIVIL